MSDYIVQPQVLSNVTLKQLTANTYTDGLDTYIVQNINGTEVLVKYIPVTPTPTLTPTVTPTITPTITPTLTPTRSPTPTATPPFVPPSYLISSYSNLRIDSTVVPSGAYTKTYSGTEFFYSGYMVNYYVTHNGVNWVITDDSYSPTIYDTNPTATNPNYVPGTGWTNHTLITPTNISPGFYCGAYSQVYVSSTVADTGLYTRSGNTFYKAGMNNYILQFMNHMGANRWVITDDGITPTVYDYVLITTYTNTFMAAANWNSGTQVLPP